MCIHFSPALQVGGWGGGGEAGGGETRDHKLLTDGPDDATKLKGHYSCQG